MGEVMFHAKLRRYRWLDALYERLRRMPLRGRLVLLTAGLSAVFVWALALLSALLLQGRVEAILADQQFAATWRIAAELDGKLRDRIEGLSAAAAWLPADLSRESLQPILAALPMLHNIFAGGIVVIGLDGRVIDDYPDGIGRHDTRHGDHDHFRQVIATRKPHVDRPVIGRVPNRPVLVIGVPVFDPAGNVRAVMIGITDLTAPNFLGFITDRELTGQGEFFIFSLDHGMIVAATDGQRAMTAAPPRGHNLLYDRMVDGYEGSGVSAGSEGISRLYSGKRVPTANWLVLAALRTDVAFAPVTLLQRSMFAVAVLLTLLAILVIRWTARRMLLPLEEAGQAMQRMSDGQAPLAPLPIRREDEIGRMIGHFNLLVEERSRQEATLKRTNRALRLLSSCNAALVHSEREQSLLDEICRRVVDEGGYRMAWAGYAEEDAEKTVCPVSRYGADEQDYRSSIVLPLIGGGRAFGALTICSADADAFGADEVRLLHELADDLAYGIVALRTRIERETAEEKLDFLAHHDPLTGLPNRLLLRDRFEQAIVGAERDGTGVALLFLDLDHFKQVNDSLGHDMGDRLLVAVVERLQGCIRDSDTISRQGGDEFIVLLNGIDDSAIIGRVARQMLDAVAEPFEIAGHMIHTSFSIGIGLYPEDGRDFDTLLKNADTALYHAKDAGRAVYNFYAARMNIDALAHLQLQNGLRNALKKGEFLLHYQPQVEVNSMRIVGVEALLRWQPPDGGLVPPGSFIPAAEQSGLIVPVGEWVLNEACRQARAWQDEGLPPMRMAVNLSALQFRRGDILATVAGALERSRLPAHCLELELTESILLQDTGVIQETLHGLKAMGVMLSIDDFGTGYSSLSYLKRLAVDKLKIDQSFVRDVAENADDAAIVRAIVQMGHTLNLSIIAEGVETNLQMAFLTRCGCDEAQGYLFSRPVPAADIGALLRQE
ncbi:MAG: EAL domain-containing protein [Rhodocyclaceae bacterium]|nr:EAL domain-containing protein [Rhodocyclaceae bacterium]